MPLTAEVSNEFALGNNSVQLHRKREMQHSELNVLRTERQGNKL